MALKNLLVHIDDSHGSTTRIQAALALARTHNAHLTGLYVVGEMPRSSFVEGLVPTEALLAQHRAHLERAEQLTARFRQTVEQAGIPVDCYIKRSPIGAIAATIAGYARYTDLVILGQTDPDEPPPGGWHLPEQVVLDCGRPALIVPYKGLIPLFGERVMVAWNGGREAARAVNDALPILERARSVTVFSVNPPPVPKGQDPGSGLDIALYLARHGIDAEVQQVQARDIGKAILSHFSRTGMDLLVMGAYRHSRVRELLLGGVTRYILEYMKLPVLMSH
jgi:nucleotide-binding universal stress UspA family protein